MGMHTKEQIMKTAKRLQVFRPKEIDAPRRVLLELVSEGLLERSSRGLYQIAGAEPSAHYSAVMACTRVPKGVVSLLTALRFHEIGTQNPGEVWLTIPIRAHRPMVDYPQIQFIRASGRSYSEGVAYHTLQGRRIPVYTVEKTIVDCFKYRNRIGLDVAIEALKDSLRQKKVNMDKLWKLAKTCRVSRIMQPYLEAIQ